MEGQGGKRDRGPEPKRRAPLELLAEALCAPLGEQVLEPGVTPVAPVPVIAEDGGDEAHRLDAVLGGDEAERLGQARGGVALVVGHAEPAAHQQVEARQAAVGHDGEESHVLGPDVHAVVGREADRGLELPGQVAVLVERLLLLGRDLLLAVEPDLVIRVRGRPELERERLGHASHGGVVGVAQRGGAAHDVPLDVAAGGDRGEERLVDPGDGGLEITLQHAVELEALPGRHPQGAVAVLVGDPLQAEVLLAADGAGGDGHPDHEAVGLLEPSRLPPASGVPVVLLVRPVELEQRGVVVAEVRQVGRQRLGDRAPQVTPVALGGLDLGFRFSGHRSHHAFLASCRLPSMWRPHSVLSVPTHRPLREYSPGPAPGTGRVQWVQPTVG